MLVWCNAANSCNRILQGKLSLSPVLYLISISAPFLCPSGGMSQFRMSLVSSFFFKFFLQVASTLTSPSPSPSPYRTLPQSQEESSQPSTAPPLNTTSADGAAKVDPDRDWLSARQLSAVGCPSRPYPRGVQVWQKGEKGGEVGKPVVHLSADLQVRKGAV